MYNENQQNKILKNKCFYKIETKLNIWMFLKVTEHSILEHIWNIYTLETKTSLTEIQRLAEGPQITVQNRQLG